MTAIEEQKNRLILIASDIIVCINVTYHYLRDKKDPANYKECQKVKECYARKLTMKHPNEKGSKLDDAFSATAVLTAEEWAKWKRKMSSNKEFTSFEFAKLSMKSNK